MQWPPTPTPALKGMKPNGFVAAASTTSSNWMPIDVAAVSISFANAMLTARNEFSRSFVNSAASVELTVCTGATRPTTSAARRTQVGVTPPITRGTTPLRVVRAARVDALGREGDEHVCADREPAVGERLDDQIAGAAHVAGRGQDDHLARTGVLDDRRRTRREGRRARAPATRRRASARTRSRRRRRRSPPSRRSASGRSPRRAVDRRT